MNKVRLVALLLIACLTTAACVPLLPPPPPPPLPLPPPPPPPPPPMPFPR